MAVVAPGPTAPIVNGMGRMSERFRIWTQLVTRVSPLTGVGSPEGVLEAFENQLYVDAAGVTGSILYVKRDADIAGDRSKGWILV